MTIRYAILGFLSWRPFTGYELKKVFADSEYFHWSGNNNQIYSTLVQLHREGLVTSEVQPQEHLPARKVYTLTPAGQGELRRWVASAPELPQSRNPFLVQLAWADLLSPAELDALLARYEEEVNLQLLMLREKERRQLPRPARTPREADLWRTLAETRLVAYEGELAWARRLRQQLAEM